MQGSLQQVGVWSRRRLAASSGPRRQRRIVAATFGFGLRMGAALQRNEVFGGMHRRAWEMDFCYALIFQRSFQSHVAPREGQETTGNSYSLLLFPLCPQALSLQVLMVGSIA